MQPPDQHTLDAARRGEQWACTEVWLCLAPRVRAFLHARGSREPDDLTSEVFLAVFRGLDGFVGGPDQFVAFVFTVARRRLVDELRRRSRRPVLAEWAEEDDTRLCESAEHEALLRVEDRDVRDLLLLLSPDQREVLELRLLADLTVAQVAEVLGKPPGAVKALQRRGLAALRGRQPSAVLPTPGQGVVTP
ncbi:RNA polymerase sigma factor [Nocardioides coralli]|uniref:RNA polymerase sigma factor n=1 Tax=Nocardioides coralli TaxID=2872154 RepID=UPI001CA3F755|nr:sigma-70 family RNA polymerase sigma factor [Nocardioides coralli]QZY28335.1 sigma-70 family RNA polymerase sigma factor [Nocardioides coralli]